MITLIAPAKLTLRLRVTGVRSDGLHLIDAEMITLDLHDTMELREGGTGLTVLGGGSDIPTGSSNLVNRALALANRRAAVTLTKRIPSQAGLGGGSSDAGAVLRWAGFDSTDPAHLSQAAGLGADVAFCLVGGRANVSGIGEVVRPLPFEPRSLTLVTPPISCSTPAVYAAWDELGGPTNLDSPNDLEAAALLVAPELARWRDELGDSTGARPVLAGSGSTWFVEGHFPGRGRVTAKATPVGWLPTF